MASIENANEKTTEAMMFTRFAVAALALSLLGAGAYAVNLDKPQTAVSSNSRTTVIEKNQNWPVKGLVTMNPCSVRACQEA
ncbi:MAG: hypothetical protein AB7S41_11730 [Parvibaculaceae bacterium]